MAQRTSSGIFNRFRLPLIDSVGEDSNPGIDAMSMDLDPPMAEQGGGGRDGDDQGWFIPLPGEVPVPSPHEEDEDRVFGPITIDLRPTEPAVIRERQAVPGFSFSRSLDMPGRDILMNFLKEDLDEALAEDMQGFTGYYSHWFDAYKTLKRLPRFQARYRRAALAFLADWTIVTSLRIRRTLTQLDVIHDRIAEVLTGWSRYIQHEFPELFVEEGEEGSYNLSRLAGYVLFDQLIVGALHDALRFKRQALTMACLNFVADARTIVCYGSVAEAFYLPSLTVGHQEAFAFLSELRRKGGELRLDLPSDLPLAPFTSELYDLFENDDRTQLFLATPRRVPFELMTYPPNSQFPLVPSFADDYEMPNPAAFSRAMAESGPDAGAGSGKNGQSVGQFIAQCRHTVTEQVGPIEQLTKPAGISFLPLCARAAMSKATSGIGLKNEDRWFFAYFLRDIGEYDIEDIGNFADSKFRYWTEKRRKHWRTKLQDYDRSVEFKLNGGLSSTPLVAPSCEKMATKDFERGERRGFYCPFATMNNSTTDEIRSLIAMSGTAIPRDTVEAIVDAAMEGKASEGCLLHYNAELEAAHRGVVKRREPIFRTSAFTHFQALRRKGCQERKM